MIRAVLNSVRSVLAVRVAHIVYRPTALLRVFLNGKTITSVQQRTRHKRCSLCNRTCSFRSRRRRQVRLSIVENFFAVFTRPWKVIYLMSLSSFLSFVLWTIIHVSPYTARRTFTSWKDRITRPSSGCDVYVFHNRLYCSLGQNDGRESARLVCIFFILPKVLYPGDNWLVIKIFRWRNWTPPVYIDCHRRSSKVIRVPSRDGSTISTTRQEINVLATFSGLRSKLTSTRTFRQVSFQYCSNARIFFPGVRKYYRSWSVYTVGSR